MQTPNMPTNLTCAKVGQNYYIYSESLGDDGITIASAISETHAAFIVRACNSHDALVKALEGMLNCNEVAEDDEQYWDLYDAASQKARAALALAKGE